MRKLKNHRITESPTQRMGNYTHRGRYMLRLILVTALVTLWLCAGGDAVHAQIAREEIRSSADVFLETFASVERQNGGERLAGSTAGMNALNGNPAGLSAMNRSGLALHAQRIPRRIAVVAKQNETERYEDYARYDLPASGVELITYSTPLKAGVMSFDFAFGHKGQFSRVNYLGKATGSFPEDNFAIGIGYAAKLMGELSLGIDARWLRSKVRDTEDREHIGHGYAYNVGLIQQLGKHLRMGGVIRDLSNGLSFTDETIPDRVHRDVLLGGSYQFHHRDTDIQIGVHLNPPFENGIRTQIGAEFWYRDFIGGRIGYLRQTEKRLNSIRMLETEQIEPETRLWKAEGPTLGLGVKFSDLYVSATYTPQMKPVENEGEHIRIEQGRSAYAFSIGGHF